MMLILIKKYNKRPIETICISSTRKRLMKDNSPLIYSCLKINEMYNKMNGRLLCSLEYNFNLGQGDTYLIIVNSIFNKQVPLSKYSYDYKQHKITHPIVKLIIQTTPKVIPSYITSNCAISLISITHVYRVFNKTHISHIFYQCVGCNYIK